MNEIDERVSVLTPEKKKLLLSKISEKNKLAHRQEKIQPVLRESYGYEFPLSYSQQRMWFLYQWEKDSPSYNIPCVFKLNFKVNAPLMEKSINILVERYEILRTTYKMVDKEAVQIIHPFEPQKLQVFDLRHQPIREEELRNTAIKEKALIPFNLENEFPVRAYLYILGQKESYLLFNIHHIACDGWSVDLILRELQSTYTSLLNHTPPALPPLTIQYADFACWQKEHEKSERFKKHRLYWKAMFDGELPVMELPTDRPRPPVRGYNGAVVKRTLPKSFYKELNRLCVEEDATLYMVTLAAYSLLLYKYTGQTDMIIGSPIANRNRTELENLVGFFVNTLPIRIKLDEKSTFREMVRQVKKIATGAFEHQDFPLEIIVEMLPIERDMSHNPLFQVSYVMQNMHMSTFDNEEENMYFTGAVNTNSSKFDMTLSTTQEFVQAEYSTDIFDRSTMEQFLEHYINILENIQKDPDQAISKINYLSEAEKEQVLINWNKTESLYDEHFHVVNCIEAHAAKSPETTALVFGGTSYTYAEMNTYSNKLAHYLISKGIGPEKIVGILVERSADFVMMMLAVLKTGGAYVPLDPSYPPDRIQYMIRESGMQILLTQNKLLSDIEPLDVSVLDLDLEDALIESQKPDNPMLLRNPNNLMYIIFTSGSTGRPKGVAVENRNFENYIQGILAHLGIHEPKSFAMVSTLAADLGLTNVFAALCTGGTLHVLSYDDSCSPDCVAAYFNNHKIDVMKVVPSQFEVFLTAEHPEYVIPRHILILAGEGLSWETVHKIKTLNPDCRIENHYGPTETTVSAIAYPIPGDISDHSGGTVPIGRPIGNVKTFVLDPFYNPVPAGVPGELYIGGKGVTRGYLNNEELTARCFIANPVSKNAADLLYRTGDRVRYLRDGTIEILGRMDRQIKIRGYRIELGEIESTITSISYVKEAVVLVKELSKTDKRIVAYIVFEKPTKLENPLGELRKALSEKLPQYMMPSHMVEADSLPLNLNGKVDVHKLPPIDFANLSIKAGGEQPQTDTEKRIFDVWKDVLELDNIGIDDNFFDLGGESFKALAVVRRICDWIGIMDFFKYPTIRLLAGFYDQGKKSENQILHKLKSSTARGKTQISLICVPYAGGSAIIYQPLAAQVPANYELYSIEIPGHEFSRKDSELVSLQSAAALCVAEIKKTVNGPVALYGHCVGAALTIEIARQLEAENLPLLRVFIGGAFPQARIPGRIFNLLSKLFPTDRTLSNKTYHEFLRALGGFNDVENKEERDFLIRNLRHDARESEGYFTAAYGNKQYQKLRAPITNIIGQRDRATELYEERYLEWGYFSSKVDLVVIPMSGHYFIKHQTDQLSAIIKNHCEPGSNPMEPAPQKEASTPKTQTAKPEKVGFLSSARKTWMTIPNLKIFFIVVVTQLISTFGSGLTGIALSVWVFAKTGSVSTFAAISSAALIPGILVLPIAGAIVDRHDRRLVMLFSDVFSALSIATLAVLMAMNSLQVWHIYIAQAILSIAGSFRGPAFIAAVAQSIPKQYLGHANGIVQFSNSTSQMIAPLVGVALYAMIGMDNIFILDCISFLIAITALAIIRFPNTLFHKMEETFAKEVLMGWKFIIKRPSMMYMIVFFFIGNMLYGVITVLFQPLILSFGSASMLATTSMLGAIGGMSAALLMSFWGGTKRRASGMVGFVILEGVCVMIAGIRPSFLCVATGIFGFWFSVTLVNAHWQSLIQTKVGLELQGRVLATNQMIATSSMPLGYLLASLLADPVFEKAMHHGGALANVFGPVIGTGTGRGIGLLMIASGLLATIWATVGFNFKPLRFMEDYLDDATPTAVIRDRDSLQAELDNHIALKK